MKAKRPWWQWLLIGLVALLIVGALFGDDDKSTDDDTAEQTTSSPAGEEASTTTTATTGEPAQTIADAQRAVDADDYDSAIAIAAALGSSEVAAIRRRIANRLGRRASAAVSAGDRGRARALIIDAIEYPSTAQVRQARARYKAAKARAVQRREARAQQRRAASEQRERDREQAEQAEPQPQGNCDPNYSGCVPAYPPDVNCPEVDGPVQVTGSDPHGLDREGDGVACE